MPTTLLRWTTRIWFVIGICVLIVGMYWTFGWMYNTVGSWWNPESNTWTPRSTGVKLGQKVVTDNGKTLAWQHLNTLVPFEIEGSPWLYVRLVPYTTETPFEVEEISRSTSYALEQSDFGARFMSSANIVIVDRNGEPVRLLNEHPGLVNIRIHEPVTPATRQWPVLDVGLVLNDTDSSGIIDRSDKESRWFFDFDGTHPICIADSTEIVHAVKLQAPYIFISKSTPIPRSNISVEDAPSRLWKYDTRTRVFARMTAVDSMVSRAQRLLLGE